MAGCLAKPRSVMPLVGAWPLRARVAFSTNWLIISAVRLLASSAPEASSGLAPVGVVDAVAQIVATDDEHKAVLANGLDENLGAWDFDLCKDFANLDTGFGRRAASASVGDGAGCVEGAEVAANGDIARADLEVDA